MPGLRLERNRQIRILALFDPNSRRFDPQLTPKSRGSFSLDARLKRT
jgi:hypothetical protein